MARKDLDSKALSELERLAVSPVAGLSVEVQRKLFAEIRDYATYDSGRKAWDAEVKAGLPADRTPTSADWILAARRAKVYCRRCAGTGRFITMVVNGKATGPGGICFRCEGKGEQSLSDGYRNSWHDRLYFGSMCQAYMS